MKWTVIFSSDGGGTFIRVSPAFTHFMQAAQWADAEAQAQGWYVDAVMCLVQ